MTGSPPPAGDEIFAGVISAETDPPGLSRLDWQRLIAASPNLRPLDRQDVAALLSDGEVVGRIRWSSRANELDVYRIVEVTPEAVADAAWNVAAALGGHFVTLAELTRC